MKLIFLISVCILSLPTYSQKKNNKVLIEGIVKNYKDVIAVEDKDYSEPLQIDDYERSFVPDSQGKFSIEFIINEPKYFRIARNIVYLCPGDHIVANIDYFDARNSTFKGGHSQENEYLKFTPYPKAGSFLEGGQNVKPTIEQTFHLLMDLAQKRKRQLSLYNSLSPEFKFLEENRVNADLLNSFYAVRWYFPYVHKLKGDSLVVFNKRFSNIIDSSVKVSVPLTLNAELMKLEVYRDVVSRILALKKQDSAGEDAKKINDWFFAKQVVYEMRTDSANSFDIERIKSIKTTKYRNQVLATYKKFLSLNGTTAADIVLTGYHGDKKQLSSLRGKIIFIDVWATWCGPCLKDQPYLDSLKEKFKGNSDVAFLSLSIDRNIPDWLSYINKKGLNGLQYIADLATLEPYHVVEIPRTIVIDRNFKIYAMRGPMPSNHETITIIQKLLEQK